MWQRASPASPRPSVFSITRTAEPPPPASSSRPTEPRPRHGAAVAAPGNTHRPGNRIIKIFHVDSPTLFDSTHGFKTKNRACKTSHSPSAATRSVHAPIKSEWHPALKPCGKSGIEIRPSNALPPPGVKAHESPMALRGVHSGSPTAEPMSGSTAHQLDALFECSLSRVASMAMCAILRTICTTLTSGSLKIFATQGRSIDGSKPLCGTTHTRRLTTRRRTRPDEFPPVIPKAAETRADIASDMMVKMCPLFSVFCTASAGSNPTNQ